MPADRARENNFLKVSSLLHQILEGIAVRRFAMNVLFD